MTREHYKCKVYTAVAANAWNSVGNYQKRTTPLDSGDVNKYKF